MCRPTRSWQRDLLRFRRWRRQTGGDTLGYGSAYKQIGSAVEMCMPLWYNSRKTAIIHLFYNYTNSGACRLLRTEKYAPLWYNIIKQLMHLSMTFRLAARQLFGRLILSKGRST